jgi:hypothetical protein
VASLLAIPPVAIKTTVAASRNRQAKVKSLCNDMTLQRLFIGSRYTFTFFN